MDPRVMRVTHFAIYKLGALLGRAKQNVTLNKFYSQDHD